MVKWLKIGLGMLMVRAYEAGANLYGMVHHPYLTWKRVTDTGHLGSSIILIILFSCYFGIREPIRWGNISWQGIIIHQINLQRIKLWASISITQIIVSVLTYFVVVCLLSFMGKLWVKQVNFTQAFVRVFKVWIYSYLPTFLWFLLTAIIFAFLPPPRQMTAKGLLFSFVFLGVSSGLLIWKVMLYLLTLKVGLNMNQKQIFWSTIFLVPLLLIFSQIMYWLKFFNIPYI